MILIELFLSVPMKEAKLIGRKTNINFNFFSFSFSVNFVFHLEILVGIATYKSECVNKVYVCM